MDVDIDFKDRNQIVDIIKPIIASIEQRGELVKHPCGVYLQSIPVVEKTALAAIPAKMAEQYGWFKFDFLNNTTYTKVKSEEHLISLMVEPPWELFMNEDFVSMLPHIRGHYDIVSVIKPKSVLDLAVIIALIRPGKRSLLHTPLAELYIKVWDRDDNNQYSFKKSHAIAYAKSIVVAANLIIEELSTAEG